MGVTPEMIFAVLNVAGVEDIGMDELVTLKGVATAIKEGDTTVEQAFPMPPKEDKGKGVEGLKSTLGVGAEKKDPPPASTTPPDAGSTGAGAPGTASASPSDPPKTAEREPGADEGEESLPFGKTEKAPIDSAEVPAYLNRATSIEDLSVRWDACKPVVDKCSAMMKKAYEKHFSERKAAIVKG
jgi:hypothetical protein